MAPSLLEWDSDHFGFPVALTPPVEPGVIKWCLEQKVRCAYCLIKAQDQKHIEWAESQGFVLADVRVTLDYPLKTAAASHSQPSVRTGAADDKPALVKLSPSLFHQSRFFTDVRFPAERAQRLYEIWMERSFDLSDKNTILVTGERGHATGLITCAIDGKNQGTIGLYAVLPKQEGKGLGQSLLGAAVEWFRARGAQSLSVVTQGRAVSAQRAYQKSGFRTSDVSLWFHRWFD